MNGEQIRAARSMLGLRVSDLAEAAGVSVPTVQRMDATKGPVAGRHGTVVAIREALEAQGIQFLHAGGFAGGPGVSLVRPKED